MFLSLINKSGDKSERGFTLIELLAVIVIVAILAIFTATGLAQATDYGKRASCTGNLKAIAVGVASYAADNNGFLPPKYHIKKNSLSAKDIQKGGRLNTLESGIQTELGDYVDLAAFECPADIGDGADKVSVFKRRGTSYDIKGADEEKKLTNPIEAKFTGSAFDDLASDLFKPWEAEDPKKVAEAPGKGELVPIKWHKSHFHRAMADGHIVALRTKEDDKWSKNEN